MNISYDSSKFYVTGGLKIQGLGSEELTTIEGESNARKLKNLPLVSSLPTVRAVLWLP